MPVKAFTIPIVVPSRPTNGAVDADGGQHAEAALELGQRDQHLALDGALGRVDVGGGDRGPVAEQRLHLAQGATEHAGDVADLVLLGERDGLVEVLLLDGRENCGANFRVALRRCCLIWMSLVIAIVSE